MAKVHELAKEASGYLYRGTREADGIGKILLPKSESEGRPEWFQELCRAAHGDMLPDDWRYEFIGDALSCIEENEDSDEDELSERFREWFDGAYVYTAQQTGWLASRADRHGYCDEAAEELGDCGQFTTTTRIALGMMREAEEVFSAVLAFLTERADELKDEAETAAEGG